MTKIKHRSTIARDLRTPKYRKRVIRSKKLYTRKRVTHATAA